MQIGRFSDTTQARSQGK